MKKSTMILIYLGCLLLSLPTFAQSGKFSVTLNSRDKVEIGTTAPSLPDGKNLSFGRKFSGTEDSFTFGIIADRHGGNPLIGWPYFEQAIRDMNSLHPDFVIMPGDLIDGYIRREGPEGAAEDFNEQFDLFASFADKLEMPLYFVAGNHDLSNSAMKDPFFTRFGRLWYSFNYRGVHFIALCTEAQPNDEGQPHHFTDEQVEWAISDIAANKEARHTVIFMHYPAWSKWNQESLMHRQWLRIEEQLKGRKYTVIAGHTHDLSTSFRNGRPYYIMATSGGSLSKPHSFYLGRTHHIGLVKVEKDSVYLSILELGATHRMDQVSKTQKPLENIATLSSLQSTKNGFRSEFSAKVINPQERPIYAEFYLQGLSPDGWNSSDGNRMTSLISPGDSATFRTVLTVPDPLVSHPPYFFITADDNGLKIVDYSEVAALFKNEDYRLITKWYSVGPFDGHPMSYTGPPFDPRQSLPAMFRDFGPENNPWDPEKKFDGGIGWKVMRSDEKGRVDLAKEYGDLVSPVGYSMSIIESPVARMSYLIFAVNDYGRIWLNEKIIGKEVFFWEDGKVTIPVWLKKGKNKIMVKSANWSGNWYFVLKLADPDHSLIF